MTRLITHLPCPLCSQPMRWNSKLCRPCYMANRIISDETRLKISRRSKGRVVTDQERRNKSIAQTGKVFTPEHRLALSISKKSKGISEANKQKMAEGRRNSPNHAWRGKHLPLEARQKIRLSLIGTRASDATKAKMSAKRKGENNGRWIDGRSFIDYSQEFQTTIRYEIKKRDDFSCKQCNLKESESQRPLHVHHIDRNKQNNAAENLITLRVSCHSLLHRDLERKRQT